MPTYLKIAAYMNCNFLGELVVLLSSNELEIKFVKSH